MQISRRKLLTGVAAAVAIRPAFPALAAISVTAIDAQLQERVRAAATRHRDAIGSLDRVGVADFSAPSRQPRFHIIDWQTGRSQTFLVAHGRGSDPGHSGWLSRFSNDPGSNASSSGAYLTGDEYVGQHGRSRRLIGLDPTNSNAEARAIVIHGAAYVSAEVVAMQGKLGRSEGCLAFAEVDVDTILEQLGPGRLIYADKI